MDKGWQGPVAYNSCVSSVRPNADLILLGASNLTMALPWVVQMGRSALGPTRFWIACGHGRSFGIHSRVMGRGLGGMIDSGLWEAFSRHRGRSVHALITDIGNDVLYGQEPEQILDWVNDAIRRIAPVKVAVSGLPMQRLEKLGPLWFSILARMLFPKHTLTHTLMQKRVAAIQSALERWAAEGRIALIEQPGHWYGLDPIHIRRRHWAQAYATMLKACGLNVEATGPSRSVKQTVGKSRPETWTRWGISKRRNQPCATLDDGSVIHRY